MSMGIEDSIALLPQNQNHKADAIPNSLINDWRIISLLRILP